MAKRVAINWMISSYTGWGVYGLNLALHWAGDPDVAATCSAPFLPTHLMIDPLRRRRLEPLLTDAAALRARLEAFGDKPLTLDAVLLAPMEATFQARPSVHNVLLSGKPTIAVTFFETGRLDAAAVSRASAFPVIVTGSTWNQQVLEAHGLKQARTVLQGVDQTLFHPAPPSGVMSDRFLVFSGGKLEHRKGQDIVMAAFKQFAARRPEAMLVSAWHSPWPAVARTLDRSGLAAPVAFTPKGQLDVAAWGAANGLRPGQVLDLGPIPNALMAQVLREMDVAVFPNRCEGGTNLVAMECMACGVPTILSRNTGHLDLIEDDNCLVLSSQAEGSDAETGWGESDVEEVVARLEEAYADREAARRIGLRGATTLSGMPWSETARRMKQIVLETSA